MEKLINEGKKDKAKKIIELAMTKMPLDKLWLLLHGRTICRRIL